MKFCKLCSYQQHTAKGTRYQQMKPRQMPTGYIRLIYSFEYLLLGNKILILIKLGTASLGFTSQIITPYFGHQPIP